MVASPSRATYAHRVALSDFRFSSPQADISLHWQTTDTGCVSVYYPHFDGTHDVYQRRDGQADLTGVSPGRCAFSGCLPYSLQFQCCLLLNTFFRHTKQSSKKEE